MPIALERNISHSKRRFREKSLAKRNRQSARVMVKKSRLIAKNLFGLKEVKQARCLLLYASKGSEVHTKPVMECAYRLKKKVALPTVDFKKRKLYFTCVKPGDRLVMEHGIPQPANRHAKKIPDSHISVTVIPGVVFDVCGNRLGTGLGFYDRFLKKLPARVSKIGLAFDFQVEPRVPAANHDVPMSKIVTEKRIIDCNNIRHKG